MVAVLCAVLGAFVGATVVWLVSASRVRSQSEALAQSRATLVMRDAELSAATMLLERSREERDEDRVRLEADFENLSNRVLQNTVHQFNQSQEAVVKERENALDRTLKPLADLLDEYKHNLVDFDKQHVAALGEVRTRAEELAVEQRRSQEETRRLNQLLGRSDHRGRWGEIQLANVLEASGLKEGIDYDLQVSSSDDAGKTQRPDCVVRMPNGSCVAVDAKFPFDAFESSLSATDADERRTHEVKHAKDLRSHVRTLRDKAYWEAIVPAPEFVACFVPSDAAVSAAFDADPELMNFAARERVLIVGPSNLLSLLWSVAMVVRHQKLSLNAEEIYRVAETIFDRIRLVAEPVSKMGRALDTQVREYNAMVTSFETRLIVSARQLQSLGGAAHAKELPELSAVERLAARPNPDKWGASDGALSDVPSLLELESFDDEEEIIEE